MTATTAPDHIFLPPEDAALFGRKYGHPAIGTVCVGDPAVEYVKREIVDLKDAEIARQRAALDAIETATATGDGLSPEATIRVNQVASHALRQTNQEKSEMAEDAFRAARREVAAHRSIQGKTFVHKKSGGRYWVDAVAINEADLVPVVLYRDSDKGTAWVRPLAEFMDGRFEAVEPTV